MSDTQTVRVINGSTPLIKLDTQEYPRYYRNLKADNKQTIFSSDTLEVSELEQYGYAVVNATTPPAGDVVTQGAPELREDGEWYQTWTVTETDPSIKFNEHKTALLKEADELVESELKIGIPFTKEVEGETVNFHLQAGPRDRSNWVGIFQVASIRKEAGVTDATSIRTYENTFIQFTPAELVDQLLALLAAIDEAYRKYWEFKDAVLKLVPGDTLPELPLGFVE
ncbi:hypothetical protein pEaSNUABM37_00342 [Erwinia phage pEa_SNUABM_37]|nr:hypothetical protein pEaSNUABM37_00342 [Erwinia phage pEa_SNUABM_37]QXO10810.1 hypothetical protein pEaSNUABM48_00342 [Erwinia phage pEa_SNUABM_48]